MFLHEIVEMRSWDGRRVGHGASGSKLRFISILFGDVVHVEGPTAGVCMLRPGFLAHHCGVRLVGVRVCAECGGSRPRGT